MRVVYENEATLSAENANRVAIERELGGLLVKVPLNYGVDWALINPNRSGIVERWVELKARTNVYNAYSTYAISAMKVTRAMQLQDRTNIPAVLVVRFSDGVYTTYFKRFMEPPVIIRMGGRSDRGDVEDQEPMWHIPIEKLSRFMDAPRGGEAVNSNGNGKDRTDEKP